MRRSSLLLPFAVACLAVQATAQTSPRYIREGKDTFRFENGHKYLVDPEIVSVKFLPSVTDAGRFIADLEGSLKGTTLVRSNRLGIHDLKVPAGADPLKVVKDLEATGLVKWAEENTIGVYIGTPNDPQYPQQFALNNTGQTGGTPDADMDAPEGWAIEDGDASIIVATLDSGADWGHPDLQTNMWLNTADPINGADDDNNGFVDDFRGWDFESNDNDPKGPFYHGTGVASCVAADGNNSTNIVGVAGGACDGVGTRWMNCMVGGFAPIGAILDDAIIYAADNGAHIITMSLTVGQSNAIDSALDYAWNTNDVFVDCAAGNNGLGGVGYPATNPDCVAVASSDHNDNVSSFSSRGPQVEVTAPGENILMLDLNGGTLTASGTSFAAPYLAGVASLALAVNPSLGANGLRALLCQTADDIDAPGFENNSGWGRINAETCLLAAPGFVPSILSNYGTGTIGSTGFAPTNQANSLPQVGNAGFVNFSTECNPNSFALLIVGFAQANTPYKGGEILVDIGLPYFRFFGATGAGGAVGTALPIPNDVLLIGESFYTQWFITDPGATGGQALSDGLAATIGS